MYIYIATSSATAQRTANALAVVVGKRLIKGRQYVTPVAFRRGLNALFFCFFPFFFFFFLFESCHALTLGYLRRLCRKVTQCNVTDN